mgnify:CR=1 FL=1
MMAVDSNIWIYYIDPTRPEHEQVSRFMDDTILSGEEILTNTAVWMEVGHYLYKTSRLPREAILDIVEGLMTLPTMIVAELDVGLLYRSLAILARLQAYPIGGRDATILAAMEKFGTRRLATHDSGFKRLAEDGLIEVIDPVTGEEVPPGRT